jgi:hypothetical protein
MISTTVEYLAFLNLNGRDQKRESNPNFEHLMSVHEEFQVLCATVIMQTDDKCIMCLCIGKE